MQDFFQMSDIFMFQLPRKIIFGNRASQKVGEEARALFGGDTVLMVTDQGVVKAGLAGPVLDSLKDSGYRVVVFDRVEPDSPMSLVMECVELARRGKVDMVLGLGGGSSIDTAKAVSFMVPYDGPIHDHLGINQVKKAGLPKVFMPTTAGTGSELSHTFVLFDDETGDKITSYSPHTFADLSIIDPTLTLSLPPKVTAESGVDAFSHALESFVTRKANPLSNLLSLRGVEMISRHLRRAFNRGPNDLEARYAMCFGVCMGTMAIRSSGIGAVHACCYPPATKYRISHGIAIGIMMPHVMRYNLVSNPAKFATVAEAMGVADPGGDPQAMGAAAADAVEQLITDVGMPTHLREIGANQDDFPGFAETVMKRYAHHVANNPRDLALEDLVAIYQSAY